MNVLSLFDGISCARVALEKANVTVDNYFASEIDEQAIFISQKHWPDTMQMGCVTNIDTSILPKINLLIGGSPCQDLSICKADRKGLDGDRSSLFYEYAKLKDLLQPDYFVLENVASMHNKERDVITNILGVEPVMLDAQVISAQRRKRLFWSNVNIKPLLPQNLFIESVLEPDNWLDITYRVSCKDPSTRAFVNAYRNLRTPKEKANTLTASGQSISNAGATNVNMGNGVIRGLMPVECERLQGLPDNYTDGLPTTVRHRLIGNGFHVDIVAHILSCL